MISIERMQDGPPKGRILSLVVCPGTGERGHRLTIRIQHDDTCCAEWAAGETPSPKQVGEWRKVAGRRAPAWARTAGTEAAICGMTAECPHRGHSAASDHDRGGKLGSCPQCGTQMQAHAAGQAKGRRLCLVSGRVVTFGMGYAVQLKQPTRLELVAGRDTDCNNRELRPARPGPFRPASIDIVDQLGPGLALVQGGLQAEENPSPAGADDHEIFMFCRDADAGHSGRAAGR